MTISAGRAEVQGVAVGEGEAVRYGDAEGESAGVGDDVGVGDAELPHAPATMATSMTAPAVPMPARRGLDVVDPESLWRSCLARMSGPLSHIGLFAWVNDI
jgi:hypothetical protein